MPKKDAQSDAGPKKTLVLLDAHAIIHRAYHALPDFRSSSGEPTGALYGVVTMLMKIVSELSPDYIAACFDLPEKTFRHETYDGYKAGRAKADDELVAQLERSRDIFEAFGIPIYDRPGFEADDMLGTIVEQMKGVKDLAIIIASGDMDTLQLADGERVRIYTLKKGINDTVLYDEKAIAERFGFEAACLPDYKGLRGDPSDNIIGIKGIGEKTATILIAEFGTIERLYESLKEDRERFKKLGLTERIIGLLEEGEEEALFSKTLATIRRDAPIDFALPEKPWRETVDRERATKLLKELEFKSLVSRFDAQFDGAQGKAPAPDAEPPAASEAVDPEDFHRTAIALHLLDSEQASPSLDDMLSYARARDYASAKRYILSEVNERGLSYVYEEIELPIIPLIKEMEARGALLDTAYLESLSKEHHREIEVLEARIYEHAGRAFNINSPKQLGEILFDELGLTAKGLRKSAGGARSTRVSELEKLKGAHPIIDDIMAYREVAKLVSTYIDPLPKMVDAGGRLHAKFSQMGTSTGRFSSSDPNLQNIPIKTPAGKRIRNAFIAPPGFVLAALDYSQIELRMAALLSQDEQLIEIFQKGSDVHAAVASRVFGVAEAEVTAEMRRRAKVINFGILYGMGVNALKDNLGTSRDEAQAFHDAYFAQFKTLAAYLEDTKAFARKHGYTTTLFGRRRYFPMINSRIPFMRATAERMAINSPIQGTATADLVKIAIRRVDEALRGAGMREGAHLILQVHDELVYEVEESRKDEIVAVIRKAMEAPLPEAFTKGMKTVPIATSAATAKNWGEMK